MGLASFNRMRKILAEEQKIKALEEKPVVEEKIEVAKVVEQPKEITEEVVEEQPKEEKPTTRRRNRNNA